MEVETVYEFYEVHWGAVTSVMHFMNHHLDEHQSPINVFINSCFFWIEVFMRLLWMDAVLGRGFKSQFLFCDDSIIIASLLGLAALQFHLIAVLRFVIIVDILSYCLRHAPGGRMEGGREAGRDGGREAGREPGRQVWRVCFEQDIRLFKSWNIWCGM